VADRRRFARSGTLALPLAVAALLLIAPGAARAAAPAAGYPPLPIGDDREFLSNLSAPSLAPGGGGSVSFTVGNPLDAPLVRAVLTVGLYAFNGFPGNATGVLPSSAPPVLANATASGPTVNVSLGSVAPHASVPGAVAIATSATTPSGTYAIRTALTFTENGTGYRLASRGWFSASEWANATELPNGSVTINLTRLGVSGVLAETAVLVSSNGIDWALAAVAGAGVVLVGAGAYVYFRRTSKSSSGVR